MCGVRHLLAYHGQTVENRIISCRQFADNRVLGWRKVTSAAGYCKACSHRVLEKTDCAIRNDFRARSIVLLTAVLGSVIFRSIHALSSHRSTAC
jgi:hypothetical protein